MRALDTLESMGYKVEIIGDNIKLSYKGKGTPDREQVAPLIQELRANKEEIVKELTTERDSSYEVLRGLFLTALKRIQWTEGLMALPEIQEAEAHMEKVWKKAESGEITIDEFKNVLTGWEELAKRSTPFLYRE